KLMPKGNFKSLTKVAICSGLPWVVRPRNTLMSPVFSATKKSPLGAVRIKRGSLSPAAYCSTLKPGGTRGHAFSGRATTLGPLPAEGVARGDGKSFRVILRDLPGFSKRKSVNGSLGGGMFRFAALPRSPAADPLGASPLARVSAFT